MVRYLVNDAHDLMMLMMMMMMMMGWLVEENYDANPRDGMEHIRSLLMLDMYEVSDLFEIFAEAAPNGELNFASFRQCFEHMVELAGGYASHEAKEEAAVVIHRLFRAFDRDQNNAVDFGELASGLSVLSGSSMDDKVLAAFRLYDINGDGMSCWSCV
jgi:hypothetical protein